MNLRTLRRDVTLFRSGMLEDGNPKDMCYIVSIALEGWLSFMGISCHLVEGAVHGHHHWWIELDDGTVVDATASQFKRPNGRAMPKVYVGPRYDWYIEGKLGPYIP